MGGVDLLHDLDSEQKKNERLSIQIVQTLASALDARDSYTRGHSSRVALYSLEIARRYGYSEKAQIEIYMMALLHDIGKIGIPDKVLRKKSQLTDKEYDLIKTHPVVGYEILNNITDMPRLGIGARWHHSSDSRFSLYAIASSLVTTCVPAYCQNALMSRIYFSMVFSLFSSSLR
ncbi:MAG: HD domain-containing protein [Clostridia bacterium]|nr:HD domain-containing protein [Clostridia bacterium]